MRLLLTATTATAALMLSGCAGPRAPFEIGTQNAPVDLVLGERAPVVQAPVGPISAPLPPTLAPFFPAPQGPQPSRPVVVAPPAAPSLGPCPDFDPIAPVATVGLTLAGPPEAGTYTYRAKTSETFGSAKSAFSGDSTWKVTVSPADPTTGGHQVTTEVRIGTTTTQRVFLVLTKAVGSGQAGGSPLDEPNATDLNAQVIDLYNTVGGSQGLPKIPRAAPNLGRYGPAGIYLVSQSAGDTTFKPTVPIPLLQTPVGNNSFTGIGTDGVTNMRFVSTVKKNSLVNACGEKLESVEVALTDGIVSGRSGAGEVQQVAFTETLHFGLQFGGLPLRDSGTVTGVVLPGGTVAPDTVQRSFDYTINVTPKRPRP